MAKVQSTNHRLILIYMNFGALHIFLNGYILCGVNCLNNTAHLSALHAMLCIEQVCTYKFREG